jgi:hypothetical protein
MPLDPTPAPVSAETASLSVPREAVRRFAAALHAGRFWMLLIGWLLIVGGIMDALSIVGILFAWLPIWIGVVLLQAAGRVAEAERSGEAATLLEALGRIRLYFVILGVFVLVMIALFVLGFLFFGSYLGAMMSTAMLHGSRM